MANYCSKNYSVKETIAHATALQQRGFYRAAKSLLVPLLKQAPEHEMLLNLYQRIEAQAQNFKNPL